MKPLSKTSLDPGISVIAAQTRPPVQLSATAIIRCARRLASTTSRALSINSAGRSASAILRLHPHRRDCLGCDAFTAAGEAETLGRGGLNADLGLGQPQHLGNSRAHGGAVRAQF